MILDYIPIPDSSNFQHKSRNRNRIENHKILKYISCKIILEYILELELYKLNRTSSSL